VSHGVTKNVGTRKKSRLRHLFGVPTSFTKGKRKGEKKKKGKKKKKKEKREKERKKEKEKRGEKGGTEGKGKRHGTPANQRLW
jgi:hypothetical protein